RGQIFEISLDGILKVSEASTLCLRRSEYKAKFDALIFTIYDCGFYPRCSKEFANSGKARFQDICGLVRDSSAAVS
ncbi:MAG TPA: hypothetical protein VK775_19600, partial [Chthoniobacterales bacterium]|nr:hypothetical protein [Chthoniobacterales bacterium]